MAGIVQRRLVSGAFISKPWLFLLEGVVTISFPLLFCGVATPAVGADFLDGDPLWAPLPLPLFP